MIKTTNHEWHGFQRFRSGSSGSLGNGQSHTRLNSLCTETNLDDQKAERDAKELNLMHLFFLPKNDISLDSKVGVRWDSSLFNSSYMIFQHYLVVLMECCLLVTDNIHKLCLVSHSVSQYFRYLQIAMAKTINNLPTIHFREN